MVRMIQAAVVLALGMVLFAATGAQAHSDLLSSTPADGEVLTTAPSVVTLQFNEEISPAGLQVVAQGPQGTVTLGTPIIEGALVTAAWPTTAAGGEYRVAYRVVSADGHPIDGSIGFSYPDAETDAAASPEPTDLGQSAVASQDQSAPASAESTQGGFPWWLGVGAVIVGVGIGAGIARFMRAKAQSPSGGAGQ